MSFDSNRASNFGGAVRAQANLLCTSCSFTANKAGLGGAVDLGRGSWAGFRDYTFMQNQAIRVGCEYGGAVRVGTRACWAFGYTYVTAAGPGPTAP